MATRIIAECDRCGHAANAHRPPDGCDGGGIDAAVNLCQCAEVPATRAPASECLTVKRVDLFGTVIETHQTEAELNGWRPTQGALL